MHKPGLGSGNLASAAQCTQASLGSRIETALLRLRAEKSYFSFPVNEDPATEAGTLTQAQQGRLGKAKVKQ